MQQHHENKNQPHYSQQSRSSSLSNKNDSSHHDQITFNHPRRGNLSCNRQVPRIQTASLEEAKLLASLADLIPVREKKNIQKRKFDLFQNERESDLDYDSLVCHEKLADEIHPLKRQVTQLRTSEGSPFKPYTRKPVNSSSESPCLGWSVRSRKGSNDHVVDGAPCRTSSYPTHLPEQRVQDERMPLILHHPPHELSFSKKDNFYDPYSVNTNSSPRVSRQLPVRVRKTKSLKSDGIVNTANDTDIGRFSRGYGCDRPFKILTKNFSWKSFPKVSMRTVPRLS